MSIHLVCSPSLVEWMGPSLWRNSTAALKNKKPTQQLTHHVQWEIIHTHTRTCARERAHTHTHTDTRTHLGSVSQCVGGTTHQMGQLVSGREGRPFWCREREEGISEQGGHRHTCKHTHTQTGRGSGEWEGQ